MNTEETIRAEREAIVKHLGKKATEHRLKAVVIRARTEKGTLSVEFDTWIAHTHKMQASELDRMSLHILTGRHVEGAE
jgi:hypothetical protein